MKRSFCILLIAALILSMPACTARREDITQQEIIAAYEAAGYRVSSRIYDEKLENGEIAYIQADHPDGDYIYFCLFETEQEAKTYKQEYYHPAMMSLFSVIYGQPRWPRWKVYGNIVVQYDEPEFFEIFQKLLSEK